MFKSPILHGCSYFYGFIPGFNGAILSVVSNVPINNEAPAVISPISIFVGPTQFFGGARRGRVCACVHKDKCALVYVNVCICI
jgi:hypothetical protein